MLEQNFKQDKLHLWLEGAKRYFALHHHLAIALSDEDCENLRTIIQHESGGNPNAVNNWDSNAAAGHPSRGLMQLIDSTYKEFAPVTTSGTPSDGGIFDPVSNIIAGVKYIHSRYGSLEKVPGIMAVKAGRPYVGY